MVKQFAWVVKFNSTFAQLVILGFYLRNLAANARVQPYEIRRPYPALCPRKCFNVYFMRSDSYSLLDHVNGTGVLRSVRGSINLSHNAGAKSVLVSVNYSATLLFDCFITK